MSLFRSVLLVIAALFATAAQAADPPRVEVTFGDLSKFTDFRVSTMSNQKEREGLAHELRRHLEHEGPDRIPAGTRLQVSITDVDLAGDYRLGGVGPNEVRVVKDMYPPRISLDFKLLRADGGIEKEGHRELRDASFMWGSSPSSTESLRFEKNLLDGWLQKEFAPPKRSANANR